MESRSFMLNVDLILNIFDLIYSILNENDFSSI